MKDHDTPKTVRLHVPDLPEDLHRQIKSTAAADGKSLKEWVVEALREKLARKASR
jgi:predicted HicB family RNase H-like nuclease